MSWFRLKYTGPPVSWVARIKIWFWLKRCERLIKRQMVKDAAAGRIWKREHVSPLVNDAKAALHRGED